MRTLAVNLVDRGCLPIVEGGFIEDTI